DASPNFQGQNGLPLHKSWWCWARSLTRWRLLSAFETTRQDHRFCQTGASWGKLGDEITQGPSEAPGLAGLTRMNIALTDDLRRLLRKKVENGQFPNEEAVVKEALIRSLIEEPSQGKPQKSSATEILEVRLPGPFIEDETALAPVDLPRPGRETACSYLHGTTRQPTLFPGE